MSPCKYPKRHSYPFCSLLSVLCGYSNLILFMLLQRVVKKKDVWDIFFPSTHAPLPPPHTHTHARALIPEHFQKHPHAEEHITQSLNSQVRAAQNSLPSFMALLYWHNNFTLKSLCNFININMCICVFKAYRIGERETERRLLKSSKSMSREFWILSPVKSSSKTVSCPLSSLSHVRTHTHALIHIKIRKSTVEGLYLIPMCIIHELYDIISHME